MAPQGGSVPKSSHLGLPGRYGLAVVAAIAAVAVRLALTPLTPAAFPLAAYPAVALASALGGLGPGAVTAVLCALAAAGIRGSGLWEPLLFLARASVAVALADSLGRAQRAAEDVRLRLEGALGEHQRVEDALISANRDLERRLGEREALLVREQAARAEAQRRQREAETTARAKDEFLAVLG